jgi:hypothetical protein
LCDNKYIDNKKGYTVAEGQNKEPYNWENETGFPNEEPEKITTSSDDIDQVEIETPVNYGEKTPKVITMPEKEEIISRLKNIVTDTYLQDRLFPVIAKHLAGKELVGEGVVIALEQAFYTYSEGITANMAGLLHLDIKRYIDALVDDEEVKLAAFKMVDEVNERRKEKK